MRDAGTRAAALVARLQQLVERDAQSYAGRLGRLQAAQGPPEPARPSATRPSRRRSSARSEVPLETARACAAWPAWPQLVATKGNPNAVSDAGVSALLAEAACRGAAYNVRINVAALADPAKGHALAEASR